LFSRRRKSGSFSQDDLCLSVSATGEKSNINNDDFAGHKVEEDARKTAAPIFT
jgi:hypothetical protein